MRALVPGTVVCTVVHGREGRFGKRRQQRHRGLEAPGGVGTKKSARRGYLRGEPGGALEIGSFPYPKQGGKNA
jgi:hypothetical protein